MLRAAPPDTRVQPIAIVYDFMTTGRLRMWIDMAPAIEGGSTMTHHDLEQTLQAAWLSVARFTCTQLTSALLLARAEQCQRATQVDELEANILAWARELAAVGRQVDPSLTADCRGRIPRRRCRAARSTPAAAAADAAGPDSPGR